MYFFLIICAYKNTIFMVFWSVSEKHTISTSIINMETAARRPIPVNH